MDKLGVSRTVEELKNKLLEYSKLNCAKDHDLLKLYLDQYDQNVFNCFVRKNDKTLSVVGLKCDICQSQYLFPITPFVHCSCGSYDPDKIIGFDVCVECHQNSEIFKEDHKYHEKVDGEVRDIYKKFYQNVLSKKTND